MNAPAAPRIPRLSKSSRAWSSADFKSVVPGRVRGKLLLLLLALSLVAIALFAVGKGASLPPLTPAKTVAASTRAM